MTHSRFLVLAALASSCAAAQPQPQPPVDFSALVALSATRLSLSRQVALSKWDSQHPVSDPPGDPREAQVIAEAVDRAADRKLSAALARAFFEDQIEASKLVQISLISSWHRAAQAPSDERADLKSQLRPALDRLQLLFLDELKRTEGLRSAPDCRAALATASAAQAASNGLTPLFAIALDRGLARVCSE